MHRSLSLTIVIATLLAAPALATAKPHPDNPGKGPDTPPGQVGRTDPPVASAGVPTIDATAEPDDPADGVATPDTAPEPDYGALCAGQSRKRVAGQPGTPFSACVTALSRLASGGADSPAAACRTLSRKRVPGQSGTPYSRCVSAAAKLQEQLEDAPADDAPADDAPADDAPADDATQQAGA